MAGCLVGAAGVLETVTGDVLLWRAARTPDASCTPGFRGRAALGMLTAVGRTPVMRHPPRATIGAGDAAPIIPC